MLPKIRIVSLQNQKQFDYINKSGIKLHSPDFIFVSASILPPQIIAPKDLIITAFGMKVSRKFSKKSVLRNKAKRRIRHLVAMLVKDSDINTGNKSLIIIPKTQFNKIKFAKLYADLKRLFVSVLAKNNQRSY
ncbi:MAG: ribonuclease P protein component [Rickettsiaceae bacterium]